MEIRIHDFNVPMDYSSCFVVKFIEEGYPKLEVEVNTSQAVKARHDAKFAIASIINLKKYNQQFIIVDKTHDLNAIQICINEEIKVLNQISVRFNLKRGWYRRLVSKYSKKYIPEETM